MAAALNSVSSQTRTIVVGLVAVTVRWPDRETLASLWVRFQIATCSFQHTPQRTPLPVGDDGLAVAGPAEDDAPLELAARHGLSDRPDEIGKVAGRSESVPKSRTLCPSARSRP